MVRKRHATGRRKKYIHVSAKMAARAPGLARWARAKNRKRAAARRRR